MATACGLAETEIEQNALTLLSEQGDNAFTYAVEQANETRVSGDRQRSRQWAAIAWAINDMVSTPARA